MWGASGLVWLHSQHCPVVVQHAFSYLRAYYFCRPHRYTAIEKVLVRALVCVIDNFHFNEAARGVAAAAGETGSAGGAPAFAPDKGANGDGSDEDVDEGEAAPPPVPNDGHPVSSDNAVHRALANVFKRALVGLLEVRSTFHPRMLLLIVRRAACRRDGPRPYCGV